MQIDVSKGTYEHIGCPKWPITRLLIEKILKPLEFRTQMQNEPIDPFGNYFSINMYNETSWDFDKNAQVVIAIDPAFGKSAGSDNTAIAILARHKHRPRSFILVEMFAGKIKSLTKTLKHIYDQYSHCQILKVVCEANYLQKIFVIDKLNKQLPFTVAPFYNKGEKILRIQSLHDPMVSKQLMIWEKAPGKEAFKEELLGWIPRPSTTSRKDDRLDALQMCYEEFVRIAGNIMPRSGKTTSKFKSRFRRE